MLDAVPENPVLAVWILNLWATVLAALSLLIAVRSLGERLAPTLGAAAAITLGLGTLVFPFATLYFAHVLAAALAFGAFFLLWREREREPRLAVVAAAGGMAGLAVTVENTLGIAAIALALYALLRPGRLRRGLGTARACSPASFRCSPSTGGLSARPSARRTVTCSRRTARSSGLC